MLGHVKCIQKQNAMVCNLHKATFYSQWNKVKKNTTFKLRNMEATLQTWGHGHVYHCGAPPLLNNKEQLLDVHLGTKESSFLFIETNVVPFLSRVGFYLFNSSGLGCWRGVDVVLKLVHTFLH